MRNHVIFANPCYLEISLSVIELENAIQNKLNFKYIGLQVIRITTSNQSAENVYSLKRNKPNQITMDFTRLILSRVHYVTNRDDNSLLVYIMEALQPKHKRVE